jgi:FAD/FMN-containing dehydrogenase
VASVYLVSATFRYRVDKTVDSNLSKKTPTFQLEELSVSVLLNDVHSQLNPIEVKEVIRPTSIAEIVAAVKDAGKSGLKISMSGGRHAMGGQQFAEDSRHLDLTGINRVLETDPDLGLIHCESGIMWPAIIEATRNMASSHKLGWGIRQKQTGVDDVTLAGSISANAHGRGLEFQPIGQDIEEMTVVTADAEIAICNRTQNSDLFSLIIGGYGLFAVIYSVKLRLSPRQKMIRIVNVLDIDDAANAIYRRLEEGCTFGDFQYAIAPDGEEFMNRGVFSCYKAVDDDSPMDEHQSDLPEDAWLKLLKLAHEDKAEAFRLYAQHYVGTDGRIYWSDTMQLSTYIPSYADYLEQNSQESASLKETLMIGEHYVPYANVINFMRDARKILTENETEVIYGTVRVISKDETSFLAWAKEDFGCVIFNLRTPHTTEGKESVANSFRRLIDASLSYGGSFFLTYHKYASPQQVEKAYPQIRDFFRMKKKYDRLELFESEWYRHYRKTFLSDK